MEAEVRKTMFHVQALNRNAVSYPTMIFIKSGILIIPVVYWFLLCYYQPFLNCCPISYDEALITKRSDYLIHLVDQVITSFGTNPVNRWFPIFLSSLQLQGHPRSSSFYICMVHI